MRRILVSDASVMVPEVIRVVCDKYLDDGHQRRHQEQVVETALLVFDLLAGNYQLTAGERRLLECSARLHDIGHFISEQRHDLHSQYLILQDENMNVLPQEIRGLLALIAGGHRKTPRGELRQYPREKRQRILQLMSLLRFADALDYTRQTNELLDIVTVRRGKLVLSLKQEVSEEFEARLLKRSRLLKKAFGLKLSIEPPASEVQVSSAVSTS
ncbi:MAG: HD domain-containing protein [Firmicutes bacterium]|nr:HD domain-containing protein [Bacillota bacterium]